MKQITWEETEAGREEEPGTEALRISTLRNWIEKVEPEMKQESLENFFFPPNFRSQSFAGSREWSVVSNVLRGHFR